MNDLDIAKKLAAITGKPLTEYYNGHITTETDMVESSSIETGTLRATSQAEDNRCQPDGRQDHSDGDGSDSIGVDVITDEISAYLKMFKATRCPNGQLTDGRQMTRKEYLSFKKGLTYENICEHPLLFKMFRSEGQNEAFFNRWLSQFPREEGDE